MVTTDMTPTPKNKLQIVAFDHDITSEYQFRQKLSKALGISSSTLRTMWVYADATRHKYNHVKAVANHFEKSIGELFKT